MTGWGTAETATRREQSGWHSHKQRRTQCQSPGEDHPLARVRWLIRETHIEIECRELRQDGSLQTIAWTYQAEEEHLLPTEEYDTQAATILYEPKDGFGYQGDGPPVQLLLCHPGEDRLLAQVEWEGVRTTVTVCHPVDWTTTAIGREAKYVGEGPVFSGEE